MPTILTLQGPNLSLLGSSMPALTGLASTLAGPVDTVKEHPWVIVLGLLAGGFLASKYAPAWGSVWGSHHAAHAREKSFNGVKPKRRKR